MNHRSRQTVVIVSSLTAILLIAVIIYLLNVTSLDLRNQAATQQTQSVEKVSVSLNNKSTQKISPYIWATNYSAGANNASDFINKYFSQNTLNELGFSQIRFPNGCQADHYDWKNAMIRFSRGGKNFDLPYMSIDEVLKAAATIKTPTQPNGAELVYVVNTEYKASRPDPCDSYPRYPGLSDNENYQILLNDIDAISKKYKGKIKTYEIGNENWGYWDPNEYVEKAKAFATTIKKNDPAAKVILVGSPSTGNNQATSTTAPNAAFQKWTSVIQANLNSQCTVNNAKLNCFDIVSDHPYYARKYDAELMSKINGISGYYSKETFSQIFSNNKKTYGSKPLAITEYNIICWDNTYNPSVWSQSAEHAFYLFEMLMQSAVNGVYATYYHVPMPNHFCGMTTGTGANSKLTVVGEVFAMTNIFKSGTLIQTNVSSPSLGIPLIKTCNTYACFAGGMNSPYVTAYSAYDVNNKLTIFVMNKNEKKSYSTDFALGGSVDTKYYNNLKIDTSAATAYGDKSFKKTSATQTSAQNFTLNIPPLSITKLTFEHTATSTPSNKPITTIPTITITSINPTITNTTKPSTTVTTKPSTTVTTKPSGTITSSPTAAATNPIITDTPFDYEMYNDKPTSNDEVPTISPSEDQQAEKPKITSNYTIFWAIVGVTTLIIPLGGYFIWDYFLKRRKTGIK